MTTIETAKGNYTGTLRECCAWQAEQQGAWASVRSEAGVAVTVDDVEFDSANLGPAVWECAIRLYEDELEDALDAHLLATGQTIAADSSADEIVGEDSWQAPAGVDVSDRMWRGMIVATILLRIAAAD